MMSNTTFDASFVCRSRQDIAGQNLPFRFSIGTQTPIYLQSASLSIP